MNPTSPLPQTAPLTATRAARDPALDALRTFAILGMMAAHTARMVPLGIRPFWAQQVLLLEPIIPSLFLLLVGVSLEKSFEAARRAGRTRGAWLGRQIKRAAGLWLISAVFFSLELGPRLPDALLAGGILANIAYAIVLTSSLLVLGGRRFGKLIIITVLLAGSVLFVWLDLRGLRIHPVNIGNAPFLPLWLFALAGAAWGLTFGNGAQESSPHKRSARLKTALKITLGVLGGLIAAGFILRYGVDALFTKPFGRSDAGRLIPAPFYGGVSQMINYYNLRPLLAATCLGIHLFAEVLLTYALSPLKERAASILFALGRHALGVYVLHLALLSSLVVTTGSRQPLTRTGQGTATWFGLVVLCMIYALWRNKHKQKLIKTT